MSQFKNQINIEHKRNENRKNGKIKCDYNVIFNKITNLNLSWIIVNKFMNEKNQNNLNEMSW